MGWLDDLYGLGVGVVPESTGAGPADPGGGRWGIAEVVIGCFIAFIGGDDSYRVGPLGQLFAALEGSRDDSTARDAHSHALVDDSSVFIYGGDLGHGVSFL